MRRRNDLAGRSLGGVSNCERSQLNNSRTVLSVFDLAPRRIGGIETMARELSRQLGDAGWRSVLCFRTEPADSVREFLSMANVSLCTLSGMARWSLQCQRNFRALIAEHRPEIVHLNFVDFLSPFPAVARLSGVQRVFFTDHISRPSEQSAFRSTLPKRLAYRWAVPVAKVICVSDFIRRCWIESDALPSDRVMAIYNGVDVERCEQFRHKRTEFRAKHGIPDDAIVVSQMASMSLEKGWPTLLHAAKTVIAANPRVHFLLAGDGKRRADFEQLARDLSLGERVRFIGLIDDPVQEGYFWASDVVCQPSEWQEAFGLSIAEAMACERPVVATRVGGIPEIVVHRESGILFDRGDAEQLAASILELADRPDLRQLWGHAGRDSCRRRFDHRLNAARTIEVYGLESLR
jgi:glycosyltransferase involved in cell wall biosynthesis